MRTVWIKCVYLIRDGDAYKIGWSTKPYSRLREVASPDGVVVHIIPSTYPCPIERALHAYFAAKVAPDRGPEWFRLDNHDVDLIRLIGSCDTYDGFAVAWGVAVCIIEERKQQLIDATHGGYVI